MGQAGARRHPEHRWFRLFDTNNPERIVPCHGTIARAACEACGAEMLFDDDCAAVRANIKDIYDPEAPAVSTNFRDGGARGKPRPSSPRSCSSAPRSPTRSSPPSETTSRAPTS
ncbi:hypothetical protein CTAYLR_007043 [Chrysophaeum taylorii]|uniref:Uncharacterized protein n=1 Tax=Chrysophaeum taylorii TaxID=2483200 RepID=A0AAD7U9C4_9STRA|nr:hypothetical protein CTAYLR_007043 [Chrysophaeum taylorii]